MPALQVRVMKLFVSNLSAILLLSACGPAQQVAQNVANNVQVKVDNTQQNELLGKLVDKLATPSSGTAMSSNATPTAAPGTVAPVPATVPSPSPLAAVLSPGQLPTPAQLITIIDCASKALASQQPDNAELKAELARYKRTAQEYSFKRASQSEWAAAYTPIAQAFERTDLKSFVKDCF